MSGWVENVGLVVSVSVFPVKVREIINLSTWNVLITGRAIKHLKGTSLLHDSDSVSVLMSLSTLSILHSRFARVFHMPTVTYDNISN